MKAYMSTGAAHAEDGSRYVPGFNVAEAEREARAILAETEPDCRPWIGKDSCWQYRPVNMMFHYDKGAASLGFAEALRAFIES